MKRLFPLALLLLLGLGQATAGNRDEARAAQSVISRFAARVGAELPFRVSVKIASAEQVAHMAGQPLPHGPARPAFCYRLKGNTLTILATDGVSACRGFYDYVRGTEGGMASWSHSRLSLSSPRDTQAFCQSPFAHRQYMNVVTYGYSCPYWDEERWDEEIDWMALHGIDMPLVLIGAEQVYREVFKDLGLTDEEIDAWEVGPAHLPWFRMGNLSGNSFDGPLGTEWNQRQERLCRHVLQRMRALGMEPVCPAFGGFVPPALTQRFAATADTTGWDWMPKACRNYRIPPVSPLFVEVGRRFIERWEQHYGRGKYYLSDSFNEMEIPSDLDLLSDYGDSVFRSITAANPDAVWVTQGWTFVWQYGQWGRERFAALTRNVPDKQMLVLYMSPEYDPARYWNTGGKPCYESYDGFCGKEWAYTLLPNMGGKNFYTGNLQQYAHDFPQEIARYAQSHDNLTAYGITAEGIENNEMLYELICDAGWGLPNMDIDAWMRHYARCRYGACPPALADFLHTLRTTAYGKYIDHPRFGWQNGAVLTGTGSAVLDSAFYLAVEQLMARAEEWLPYASPALEADLAEAAAMYLGGKADEYGKTLNRLIDSIAASRSPREREHLASLAGRLIAKIDRTLMVLDSVIAIHPQGLELWEQRAMASSQDTSTQARNVRNARRIVTIWYGNHQGNEPVQDYAAKIWSGLVRDYYRPRAIGAWRNKLRQAVKPSMAEPQTLPFDQVEFENRFVAAAPRLTPKPVMTEQKLEFIARAIRQNQ